MIINKISHFKYSIFICVLSSVSIIKRFYPGGKPPKLPLSKEIPKLPQQPLQPPKSTPSQSIQQTHPTYTTQRHISEYTFPKDQEKAAQKTIHDAYKHKNYTTPVIIKDNKDTTLSSESLPSESTTEDLQNEMTKAYEKGIIDYANTGKYGPNGSPQLTRKGHELNRISSKKEMPVKKKSEDISDDIIKRDDIYIGGILHVKEDTLILLPHQSHAIIVKENTADSSLEAIAYLTSSSGTKIGINGLTGCENPKLSDSKVNESPHPQYAVPLIPPLIIQPDDFKEIPKITEYLEDANIIVTLDDINSQTSQYESKPYKKEGVSEEKLRDLNDLNDFVERNPQKKDGIESSAEITEPNINNNDEHAKLAETLD